MDRNRSFYCHRCNQQVRINLEEWQCAECQSGFVEELPAQPRRTVTETAGLPGIMGLFGSRSSNSRNGPMGGMVRVSLTSQNSQSPRIRIGNQSQMSQNGFGISFGGPGGSAQLRQDLQNMIQNILVFGSSSGVNQGNFNMNDFAWGENGLDDIITQLLQQVEGGAPPTPQTVMDSLKPQMFTKDIQSKSTQCSVCLCDFELSEEVIQLPVCGHVFHPPCIRNWLNLHNSCPICRSGLTDAAPSIGSATPSQIP